MFFIGVDVLVGQIDAAGDADISVYDADFPMVAVVHKNVEGGLKGVEHLHLDAALLQLFIVASGERADGTEIVVDDPNVHAFFHLVREDVENRIPHFPFFDDKVF